MSVYGCELDNYRVSLWIPQKDPYLDSFPHIFPSFLDCVMTDIYYIFFMLSQTRVLLDEARYVGTD
jgi:hypothetical protein